MGVLERQIAERQVAGLPLSVATSLAIESACGIHPDISVDTAPIKAFQLLYVNIRTLIRNIHGAVSTEVKKILTPQVIFYALSEELSIIESAISDHTKGQCHVKYYLCDYKDVPAKFPYAHLKAINSPLQEHYIKLESGVIKMLSDNLGGILNKHDFCNFGISITPPTRVVKAMMLTHLPLDLLSEKNFFVLKLLESHTGAIKNKAQWNTKLTDGKQLPRIPFNRVTLQIFGDNRAMFMPMDAKLRNSIKELADAKNWTAVTTIEKIEYDVKDHRDPGLKSLIQLLK